MQDKQEKASKIIFSLEKYVGTYECLSVRSPQKVAETENFAEESCFNCYKNIYNLPT